MDRPAYRSFAFLKSMLNWPEALFYACCCEGWIPRHFCVAASAVASMPFAKSFMVYYDYVYVFYYVRLVIMVPYSKAMK